MERKGRGEPRPVITIAPGAFQGDTPEDISNQRQKAEAQVLQDHGYNPPRRHGPLYGKAREFFTGEKLSPEQMRRGIFSTLFKRKPK